MPYSVMVVDQRPLMLSRLIEPLRDAGYEVDTATTFEAAKARIAEHAPHLLIAASRLGLYNGLHLVLRARYDHPGMAAIVTAQGKDPVLEAEASSLGAECALAPETSAELLALVSRTFASKPM